MLAWAKRTTRWLSSVLALASMALLAPSMVRAQQLEPWRVVAVPVLSLPALDGATVDLVAQGGNLVIVHFFATWCEPCRDELRSLEQLAEAHAAGTFRILAVSVGEPRDRVRRFLERNNINARYPILIDFDKRAMRAWGVEILPTSYVLDRALCPLWKVAGALEWDVEPTLSMIASEVAGIGRATGRRGHEHCIVKGGTQ